MQKKNYVFLDFIEWDAKVWEKKNQLIREVPQMRKRINVFSENVSSTFFPYFS